MIFAYFLLSVTLALVRLMLMRSLQNQCTDHSGRPHREREIFFYIHVLQPTPAFLVPATPALHVRRRSTFLVVFHHSALHLRSLSLMVLSLRTPTGDKYLTVSYVHPSTALAVPLIDTAGYIADAFLVLSPIILVLPSGPSHTVGDGVKRLTRDRTYVQSI
jgi:hypothetical protein